ncbi:retrovirus-related pol polyprotein from transposon TNT 1-94 [Tanacetum coccineum]|uniref:Retrovirus-related pol polyprotein from transposon TNT 1-94 n=1 Tax=Tanacetum coccineum TaxID=301880 RepID=A0ABQ4WWA9_9ASTR
MKAKLALLEASSFTSQSPKTFQSKNKGIVAETFNWDEEEVSDDEEMTQVKVLMALADDELLVGKNHDRNGEWIDNTMRKGDSTSSEVMTLTYQDHSLRERPGLGKFDATSDDEYFLGYSFVSNAFRDFNTRRQQIEETYHVAFDESMEAIRQYQANFNFSYYIIPHGRLLTELTKDTHVPEVIAPNEQDTPHTKDVKGMLTRSMAAKLTTTSASKCLFANFLPEIEPKKGYRQEEGINHDETFARIARMEAIRIFLAFATYMNFKVFQMDVKSAFLNEKLKEEVYGKQPPSFESSEFSNYVCKLDKSLYGLKQALKAWPDIQFSTLLCARYQSNPKESHLIDVKRIPRYLKGTPSLGLWYLKYLGFDLKGYANSDYAICNMDKKAPQLPVKYLEAN